MDEEEAESEFVDADIDGDDLVRWNEFVEEFYGLEPSDQNNILQMGKKELYFTLYSTLSNLITSNLVPFSVKK